MLWQLFHSVSYIGIKWATNDISIKLVKTLLILIPYKTSLIYWYQEKTECSWLTKYFLVFNKHCWLVYS